MPDLGEMSSDGTQIWNGYEWRHIVSDMFGLSEHARAMGVALAKQKEERVLKLLLEEEAKRKLYARSRIEMVLDADD